MGQSLKQGCFFFLYNLLGSHRDEQKGESSFDELLLSGKLNKMLIGFSFWEGKVGRQSKLIAPELVRATGKSLRLGSQVKLELITFSGFRTTS